MAGSTITFELVVGLPVMRRAVGFLFGHSELSARECFLALGDEARRNLLARMNYWIAWNNSPAKWFHGFPNDPEHKNCFVFKYQEKRFYGFLYHPTPKSNPRFQLCVLCSYDSKSEWETDMVHLNRAEAWLLAAAAILAIRRLFPDEEAKKR